MAAEAKVILDSVSPDGIRLTTMEVKFHRFVLAEFNTHRAFSRNSASSRAIPVKKIIDRVVNDTAIPEEFGTNQPGMQAGPKLAGSDLFDAEIIWTSAAEEAVGLATQLIEEVNVHKQVTNRLLEPFMWHTVIVTSVDYDNFFAQRCSPLAQPEIRVAAELMKVAYDYSVPQKVDYGEWHTPYIQWDEQELDWETKKQISSARCARVSYLTHDGIRDYNEDVKLYERLASAEPPHWSPLEHVATPLRFDSDLDVSGNFVQFKKTVHSGLEFWVPRGWAQFRHNNDN